MSGCHWVRGALQGCVAPRPDGGGRCCRGVPRRGERAVQWAGPGLHRSAPRPARRQAGLPGMGSLSALDVAVELGGTWRQYEELQITPLAGGLELAHELTAAVDLNGPDGEGGG